MELINLVHKNLSEITGAFPTMITPYKDGKVDYNCVEMLVEWYWKCGCDGIFASCQSSEIFFLDKTDRIKLARCVKNKADQLAMNDKSRKPMVIVASGHVSDDINDQAYELNGIADTGVDAVIFISNRMDISNTNDDAWKKDAEKLLSLLNKDIALGVYECPTPYKRLLTDEMIKWCVGTDRFYFIKDTCCNANLIKERINLIGTHHLRLFNANAQTLLESLKSGGAGYCGIMCNFHPQLYVWLVQNYDKYPEKAEKIGAFLSVTAFTEALTYPATAKYYLNTFENIPIDIYSKTCDYNRFSDYDRLCMKQMKLLSDYIMGGELLG